MSVLFHRNPLAMTVFVSAALLAAPGVADQPVDVVEAVFAHDGDQSTPPGGYEIWDDEISAIWQDMLARASEADTTTPMVFPPPGGDLSVDVISQTESEAEIFSVYDDGKSSAEVTFDLVGSAGTWKIREVWQDGPDGSRRLISELLQQLP